MTQPMRQRRPRANHEFAIDPVFPALRQLSRELRDFTEREIGPLVDARPLDELKLALQEAAANLIEHGEIRDGGIRISFSWDGSEFVVRLTTRGRPFDPRTTDESLPDADDLQEGGYGLYLIRRLTDQLDYQTVGPEHTLTMVKVFCIPGGDL